MTFKNILSGIIGGLIGAILLYLLESNNYFGIGNMSAYVLLFFLIIGILTSLIIDFKISKSTPQLIRTIIGFIAFVLSLSITSLSDVGTISAGAIGMILFLGLGMSLIIAQIFKY